MSTEKNISGAELKEAVQSALDKSFNIESKYYPGGSALIKTDEGIILVEVQKPYRTYKKMGNYPGHEGWKK